MWEGSFSLGSGTEEPEHVPGGYPEREQAVVEIHQKFEDRNVKEKYFRTMPFLRTVSPDFGTGLWSKVELILRIDLGKRGIEFVNITDHPVHAEASGCMRVGEYLLAKSLFSYIFTPYASIRLE